MVTARIVKGSTKSKFDMVTLDFSVSGLTGRMVSVELQYSLRPGL
jgi:hypothetical protein